MKFEINRLEMLKAAKNAARVAPTGAPVEVLNGIFIESDEDSGHIFMTATNLETAIQYKVKASVTNSGTMLVSARIIVGMLSLLQGEFITFESAGENALVVKGGRCVYQVNCALSKHYPKPIMPFPEETAKLSGICSLAGRTAFAIAKDNSKPVLQCVDVKLRGNAVHATACDGFRIMLVKGEAESQGTREFLLPGRALQLLASVSSDEDIYDVGDVGGEIVFVREDMMFTMKKIPGEYIDTNKVVQSIKPAYTAVADSKELKAALELIKIDTDTAPVKLNFSDGQIHLHRNSKDGEANTAVSAAISSGTPDSGFYYHVDNLYKLFQVVDGRVRLEIDARGMMIVKTVNEVYVQTPQRPPAKSKEVAA